MAFKPSRRLFIQSVAALVASAAAPPVLAAGRAPFVEVGEIVSSLVFHMWDKPAAPIGPLYVHEIGAWDGTGYPIVLMICGWRVEEREFYDGWYDFEWSNLLRDVPQRFWAIPGHSERYPNVHAYVREKRFGESPEVMRRTMEINRRNGPPLERERVAPRRA